MRRLFGSFERAMALSGLLHAILIAAALVPSGPLKNLYEQGPLPFKSGVQVSLYSPGKRSHALGDRPRKTSAGSGAKSSSAEVGQGPQGVRSEAQSMGAIVPIYPRESRIKRQTGLVEVEVGIDAQGKVQTLKLLNESETGHIPLLVQSALEAVRSAHFSPAMGPQGAIASVKKLSFTFKLN